MCAKEMCEQSSQIIWRYCSTSLFNVGETLKHNKSPEDMRKLTNLLGYCPPTIDKIIKSVHHQKWEEGPRETQISDEAKSRTFLESLPDAFFRSQKEEMSG